VKPGRQQPNRTEGLARVLAVTVVFVILAYYGKWMAAAGVVLAALGGTLMVQSGRRDLGFLLGMLIGLAGLVLFVWGMF